MKREAFTWGEMEHWTGADLIETVALITDQDEADSFLEAYTTVCNDEAHATSNIAYMLRIVGGEDAQESADLFLVDISRPTPPLQWFAGSSMGVKVES